MNTTTQASEAFAAAVEDIRKQGIKIAQGLRHDGCACGCSGYKKPATWGDAATVENYAYTKAGTSNDRIAYFYHRGSNENPTQAAQVVASTFYSYGFDVDWDGTIGDTVRVDRQAYETPTADRGPYMDTTTLSEFMHAVMTAAAERWAGVKFTTE